MSATPFTLYATALEALMRGQIDFDNDALVMALLTNSYTHDQLAHETWSDVSAAEAAGTGYTAGGVLLQNVTVGMDGLVATLDAADVTWSGSTLANVGHAVIVQRAGASLAGTDRLVFHSDLIASGAISTTNGPLSVTISPSGIYAITATAAA